MATTDVRTLLESAKTVAVVGASTDPDKPSHRIPKSLVDAGFDVIPVHPSAEEIFGRPAVRSIEEIDRHIDIVDVFRPAEEAPAIAHQAIAAGAGAVWLQLGISSDEARAVADEAGVGYVEDLCIGATVRKLGITR